MQDWEIVDMTWLWEDLYETKIWFREVDKLVRIPSKKNGLPGEDLLQCIVGVAETSPGKAYGKFVWLRVAFLFWCVALGRVLTVDNLRKLSI